MAEVEFTATIQQANPIITAVIDQPLPVITAITAGVPGAQGPPGADGLNGTPVVALPYTAWPPVSPDPDTLYLRLAP